jgi:hypothetical protein
MKRLHAPCAIGKMERFALTHGEAEPPDGGRNLLGPIGLASQFDNDFYRIGRSEPCFRRIGIDELEARCMKARGNNQGAGQKESKEQTWPQAHGLIMQRSSPFQS